MTCAETLKEVLKAFDWSSVSYGSEPPIGIVGIDDLSGLPPDHYVKLTDDSEEPEFTLNEVRLVSPQFCLLEAKEINTTKRTNLYAALKTCFQNSSYSIIFSNVKPKNLRQPYQINLRIQMLL